jgi:hypothetical protein
LHTAGVVLSSCLVSAWRLALWRAVSLAKPQNAPVLEAPQPQDHVPLNARHRGACVSVLGERACRCYYGFMVSAGQLPLRLPGSQGRLLVTRTCPSWMSGAEANRDLQWPCDAGFALLFPVAARMQGHDCGERLVVHDHQQVCVNGCSGVGTCSRGFCSCPAGRFGVDCSRSKVGSLASPPELLF